MILRCDDANTYQGRERMQKESTIASAIHPLLACSQNDVKMSHITIITIFAILLFAAIYHLPSILSCDRVVCIIIINCIIHPY